jgi:NitT/TauT family transport system substrate-binding protein
MRTWRHIVPVLCAVLVLAASAPPATFGVPAAAPEPELRIGLEAGGTLTWELHAMHDLGLDRRYGLNLLLTRYTTKAAAELALRSRDIDVKVDDWLFATRMRSQEVAVQAVDAFSRAVGGVVVRTGGPVRGIGDLRGRRLGVTSPGDKSYLVLRAVAISEHAFDPERDSHVISASPLLLDELFRRGDMDAILQYWQFIPALLSTGRFRELVSTATLVGRLVPNAGVPLLVVVATDDVVRTRPGVVRAFLRALRETKRALASRTDLWDALAGEGVLGIPDPPLVNGVRVRYQRGLPAGWTPATIAALQAVTAKIVAVAGAGIVGASQMDPRAYNVDLAGR